MYRLKTDSGPVVTDHKDYRKFLRDFIGGQKKRNAKFSLAYYSRRLGLSEAYLKLVAQGRRNLDPDKAYALSAALGLSPPERDFFLDLVLENQAESPALKRRLRLRLKDQSRNKFSYQKDADFRVVFEDSLAWEIFSLIGIDGFRAHPAWIVKKLKNRRATQAAVAETLAKLVRLGAVEKTPAGNYRAGDLLIPRRFNPTQAYLAALDRAREHLEGGPVDSSYFDSLCLILGMAEFHEIRALLEETKSKISEIIGTAKGPKTHIAFFNANLFLASRS